MMVGSSQTAAVLPYSDELLERQQSHAHASTTIGIIAGALPVQQSLDDTGANPTWAPSPPLASVLILTSAAAQQVLRTRTDLSTSLTSAAQASEANLGMLHAVLELAESELSRVKALPPLAERLWSYEDASTGKRCGPHTLAELMDLLRGREPTLVQHAGAREPLPFHRALAKFLEVMPALVAVLEARQAHSAALAELERQVSMVSADNTPAPPSCMRAHMCGIHAQYLLCLGELWLRAGHRIVHDEYLQRVEHHFATSPLACMSIHACMCDVGGM